jgi:hypothetical protein
MAGSPAGVTKCSRTSASRRVRRCLHRRRSSFARRHGRSTSRAPCQPTTRAQPREQSQTVRAPGASKTRSPLPSRHDWTTAPRARAMTSASWLPATSGPAGSRRSTRPSAPNAAPGPQFGGHLPIPANRSFWSSISTREVSLDTLDARDVVTGVVAIRDQGQTGEMWPICGPPSRSCARGI